MSTTPLILLNKPPSKGEVYNDWNGNVYDFFMTLATPERFQAFRRCALGERGHEPEESYGWFSNIRQLLNDPQPRVIASGLEHISARCRKKLSEIDGLAAVFARLIRVQLECCPILTCVSRYDAPQYLAVCDFSNLSRNGDNSPDEFRPTEPDALTNALLNYSGSVLVFDYGDRNYAQFAAWEHFIIDEWAVWRKLSNWARKHGRALCYS